MKVNDAVQNSSKGRAKWVQEVQRTLETKLQLDVLTITRGSFLVDITKIAEKDENFLENYCKIYATEVILLHKIT